MENESTVGTVKSWFDEKGFGFIVQPRIHGDIFVHHTQIRMEGRRSLNPGQAVRFRTARSSKGFSAIDVEPIDDNGVARCRACGQEVRS